MPDKVINVAIIGAGENSIPILKTLTALKNFKILGLADEKKDAPGLALAKQFGINVDLNFSELARQKRLNLIIIETPGSPSFAKALEKIVPEDVQVIDGISAQLMFELAREREKLRKIETSLQSMNSAVLVIDEKKKILLINPLAESFLGIEGEQVLNKDVHGQIPQDGVRLLLDGFADQESRSLIKETQITNPKDGITRDVKVRLGKIHDYSGNAMGAVMVLDDITKEKEVDKMKTEFISTVSHELRTPLTILEEFVSIISDEIPGKLTKDQKEYIGIIKGNINRLGRLINDILDISKIEAAKMEFKKTLVDITKLANDVLSALKPEAEGKHIELRTSFRLPRPSVYADADKIVQIFTNLIGNAIKFTAENGQITVEIAEKEKEIECGVADTGVGIAPENLDKLFGRFQQFDRVPGPGAKGTGLGLAITKDLVEMHNGRIWAESKPGKGSKFTFTLPKHTAESLFKESVDNGIKQAVKNGTKMSIIVISIAELDKLKQELSDERIGSILKDMEGVIKSSLRWTGDVVSRGSEGMVVLIDCDKENALIVKGRLEQSLKDYLARKKLAGKIKLSSGYATYPDDGKNDEELIKKAKIHGQQIIS